MKLTREFYARETLQVARELLGKILVHEINGVKLMGKIVETEAYIGSIDKACHAYGGKHTPRVETLYGMPGIAYVYFIYGMYHCFNVITKEEGFPEGVLIRAIEPIDGLDEMAKLRFKKEYNELEKAQIKNLTTGPSKLCIAMNINKENNQQDLCTSELYIEESVDKEEIQIIEDKRIGINYAEEAVDFLWRFYIKDNICVSVKPRV
ncbi:DNA-3-methyladenine glycosylase [Clostridium estertheticum]|uniref:Putative 3-methyladenine DNA glycosylase n=1 Tax=Clostridium estertheticum TaxID=238834 RepID=A0A7Y3WQX3_9CLOT|nr:DNA-3-methyladenine glycosylase [Clostridium estertheticum]MBX4262655.1 DNA-3-methyladenine glycosylase [Clostridium estertheticum]NNU74491.1 DNA-3-methyladenine glycosylase [Clostridium estertheticum]WBL49223.1 DNA-3-methyladenine glycosylase [Clostridium estertheticum]WLC72535.1 DNA-3-methyladenine glycosylase [Clostridium estertheticum]